MMFARVITAEVAASEFDSAMQIAQQQLPAARQQPGFKGFYLLADTETGKLMTISLWEAREDLAAVEAQAAQIRSQAAPAIGVTAPHLQTYEVTMRA
jgi:heme-degrading monooxygenase HmoA